MLTKITPAVLRTISPGDLIETEGVFLGITKEPLAWLCTSRSHETRQYMFKVNYLGVSLGQMAVFVDGEPGKEVIHAERM